MMRHFYLLFLCGFTAIGFALTDVRINARTYVGACNETANPELMVAIRFFENNEWRTQGWWKIKSQTCQKLGPFPSEKAIYGFATTSSTDPEASEWRPTWSNELACINPETTFDYAEKADGSCEAREAIKIPMGKLSDSGFRGLVNFDMKESFISVFRSASSGEIAISKDRKADSAKLAAKASCTANDCEELVQVKNQCFSFAIGHDAAKDYGWGKNASLAKAHELALKNCRESSQEPELCRIIASECP
jgi:hypothetical protein